MARIICLANSWKHGERCIAGIDQRSGACELELSVRNTPRSTGSNQWKGTLVTLNGQTLFDASITDPVFVEKLETDYRPKNPCLVTVSLGMPHRPPEWEGDDPCWKLIASVIEFSVSDLIWVEMQRLGWSIAQGRDYLQQTYHKRSRQQLSDLELGEFLTYLKSLLWVNG